MTGEYRGVDQKIHEARGFANYTIFSLWDTYRAAHPLYALIQAERDADMINSMLAHYDQSPDHMLPIWLLQANETWCMIGYHAVPVIVDAYFKGVKGFDVARAYDAIKTTAMNPDYDGLADYDRLGWVPCDVESESVSKTLEYGYDDWCIAQMAKSLGKKADYEHFMHRAAGYKNIFDPKVEVHARQGPGRLLAHAFRSERPHRHHRRHQLAILLVRSAGRAGPDRLARRQRKLREETRPTVRRRQAAKTSRTKRCTA